MSQNNSFQSPRRANEECRVCQDDIDQARIQARRKRREHYNSVHTQCHAGTPAEKRQMQSDCFTPFLSSLPFLFVLEKQSVQLCRNRFRSSTRLKSRTLFQRLSKFATPLLMIHLFLGCLFPWCFHISILCRNKKDWGEAESRTRTPRN